MNGISISYVMHVRAVHAEIMILCHATAISVFMIAQR
jgi:hypothetical protein